MNPSKIKPFYSIILAICLSIFLSSGLRAQELNTIAPDIMLEDPQGSPQQLSKLKGNLILLKFWVSWDNASRTSNAELGKLYQKFHNQKYSNATNFEIVTVSVDSEKSLWEAAVKKDALPGKNHWIDYYSRYAAMYKINKLPTSFLLDEQGIVIAVNPDVANIERILTTRLQPSVLASTTTVPTTTTAAPLPMSDKPVLYSTPPASIPMPTTPTATTLPATTPSVLSIEPTTYKIQIGAYKRVLLSDFYGISKYGNIVTEDVPNGSVKRVLLGTYNNVAAAQDALQKVKTDGYADAFLVMYNNDSRQGAVPKDMVATNTATTYIAPVATSTTIAPEVLNVVNVAPTNTITPVATTTTATSGTFYDNLNQPAYATSPSSGIATVTSPQIGISPSYTLPASGTVTTGNGWTTTSSTTTTYSSTAAAAPTTYSTTTAKPATYVSGNVTPTVTILPPPPGAITDVNSIPYGQLSDSYTGAGNFTPVATQSYTANPASYTATTTTTTPSNVRTGTTTKTTTPAPSNTVTYTTIPAPVTGNSNTPTAKPATTTAPASNRTATTPAPNGVAGSLPSSVYNNSDYPTNSTPAPTPTPVTQPTNASKLGLGAAVDSYLDNYNYTIDDDSKKSKKKKKKRKK